MPDFFFRRISPLKFIIILLIFVTFTFTAFLAFTGDRLVVICPEELLLRLDAFPRYKIRTEYGQVSADRQAGISNGKIAFEYGIDEVGLCGSEAVFLLMYIHSSPDRFERRAFIRSSWGNSYLQLSFRMKVVFIIGQQDGEDLQIKLLNESRIHGDIVQANFKDSYRNLTLKEAAGLHWSTTHCPQAKFIMKLDDDLVVQPWSLLPLLLATPEQTLILCHTLPAGYKVRRDPGDKWYVPVDIYQPETYPEYCSGGVRVYTADAAVKLLNNSGSWKDHEMPIEDVYYTGIVANRASVARRHVGQLFYSYRTLEDTGGLPYVVSHATNFDLQQRVWNDFKRAVLGRHHCYSRLLT